MFFRNVDMDKFSSFANPDAEKLCDLSICLVFQKQHYKQYKCVGIFHVFLQNVSLKL